MEEITLVLVCLVANGLLSAVEMAFVSVSRPQLRAYASGGSKRAALLLELRQKPERILSVLQIGITLVGAIAAAVSGAGAEEAISPILQHTYGLEENHAELVAILSVVIPLTFLNVVFGELVPKAISLKKPHRIAIAAAPWLRLFDRLMSPLVSLFERSTKLIIRIFFRIPSEANPSTEDIIEVSGLKTSTKQYVLSLIKAEKRRAVDVMVEWKTVNAVKRNAEVQAIENEILTSGHTRLPVMLEDGSNVVGLIHSKEILRVIKAGVGSWVDYIRPILRARSQDPILEIFLKMQQNRSHMAVVYDRMDIVGIITLEDIVEEFMGDLFDEDDDGKIKKLLSARNRKP